MKAVAAFSMSAAILFGQAVTIAEAQTPAVPKFRGTYAFISMHQCEANITVGVEAVMVAPPDVLANAVKNVDPKYAGNMGTQTGYITFTPGPNPTKGHLVLTSTKIEGGAVRVHGSGFNWSQSAFNIPNTAYSANGTAFTLGAENFAMTYGNVVGGIARTVNLIERDLSNTNGDQNCLLAIAATWQK